MKEIFAFAILIVLALGGYMIYTGAQPLETQHFENYEAEFRKEIDILKKNQDTMKRSLNRLEHNVDTLKTGQSVIYKQVKQNGTKQSFLDDILKEF